PLPCPSEWPTAIGGFSGTLRLTWIKCFEQPCVQQAEPKLHSYGGVKPPNWAFGELEFAQKASPAWKARMIKEVEPPSIRLKLALLRRLIVVASLVLAASHPATALDAVSMQLKWKHQFQFAGYYQALEQGFYRDAGLDVTIREGGPGIDVSEAVAAGKSDFGVCTASVLRDWAAGRRLVVLAAIFQRSPAVILVARRADISSVSD